MTDIVTLQNFLIKAHEIFPTSEDVYHSITLMDDKKSLQVNILVAELKQFWYVRPETNEEWENSSKILNEVKAATRLARIKMENEKGK